ncbi:MAG: hypothetical protein Q7W45_08645 [Bacteroidota bacterium]|nr:hypothetical protein [Bacteroidota bacterium]MDP3144254.1 hypothetical protein [Bacteroidota bacterium]
MKKLVFLCLFSIVSFFVKAQDMIVKKDGSIVKVKVIEIGEETIKYKKSDNPDGPTYSVSKSSLTSINYENGEVEKFESSEKVAKKNEDEDEDSEKEEKPKKNPVLEDENLKKTIEGVAKDCGEQLIRNCANGKVDNSTTEVFWDGVYKDAITNEIIVPIRASWKPKWTDGAGKWVKGKVLIGTDGKKKWVYQNDNGLAFSSCAKGFKFK